MPHLTIKELGSIEEALRLEGISFKNAAALASVTRDPQVQQICVEMQNVAEEHINELITELEEY